MPSHLAPLGVDTADLPRLVLEEPNIVRDPLDEPAWVPTTAIQLDAMHGLMDHRADVAKMRFEVLDYPVIRPPPAAATPL